MNQQPIITVEQMLRNSYRKGYQAGVQAGEQRAEHFTPVCPLHLVPLWTEVSPTKDGSWLFCIFCRQNAFIRHTEAMKPIKPVPGMHKTRLNPFPDTDTSWLNSDVSEEQTREMPIMQTQKMPAL